MFNFIQQLPPNLILFTIILVFIPSIFSIYLRFTLYKYLTFLEERVRRLINRGERGSQPRIINELERRFKEASSKLDQVNTGALVDQAYSQEKIRFIAWDISCEQADSFCRTLPNLLLAFGLLGTFIGITINLSSLSQTINQTNSISIENLVKEIQQPLKGMGIAFTTSLCGIFCSALITVINLLINTSVAKYKLISVIEDYLDNIYLLKVQGNTRLDEAVDRLVNEFRDFLGRFGSTVRSAVESSLGEKIQEIVDVNKKANELANRVYNGFQESAGTISSSATQLNYAVSSFENSVVTMLKSVDKYQQVAQTFENSNFAQKLSEATTDLAHTQSNFSQSAISLANVAQSIERAVNELQISSERIANLGEKFNALNQTSTQVLELHQNNQQSLHNIIPKLHQGAESFIPVVKIIDNLQQQILNKVDNLSKMQNDLTKLVEMLKQHTEQVNLGIENLGDRVTHTNNYQSRVLGEKLQEYMQHLNENQCSYTQNQVEEKQVKVDKLLKTTS